MRNNYDGKLKVGDFVSWRGGFGAHPPKAAQIKNIEICRPGEKEGGRSVSMITWGEVRNLNVVVDLENGHWARGSQISPM